MKILTLMAPAAQAKPEPLKPTIETVSPLVLDSVVNEQLGQEVKYVLIIASSHSC